jgi:hypothetical protein
VRNAAKRLENDMKFMSSDKFKNDCRLVKKSHFTRNRKMPLPKLILATLFRKKEVLKLN